MQEVSQKRTSFPSVYSARVDGSGRIVVPAEFRERFQIHPGDQLILSEVAGSLTVKSHDQILAEAQVLFSGLAPADVVLSEELIRERRAEAAREAAKDAAAGD